MWFILGIFSALSLGFYDICKKKSLQGNAVIPVLFFSILCSGILLLPFLLVSRFWPEALSGTMFYVPAVDFHTHVLIFFKSFLVLASWLCAYFSMKNLPITIVSPVNATRPMWTLLGAVTIFQEQLSGFQWAGIAVALLSIFMFSVVGNKEGVSFTHNKWIWCLLLATLLGACSGLYDKYLMRSLDRMAVQVYYIFYQIVLMAIILMVMWYPHRKKHTLFVWRHVIVLISVFLIVSDFLYFYALSLPDSLISVLSTVRRGGVIVPFVYGALYMHEKNVRLKALCLGGVILGMIFLFLGGS